VHRSFSDNRKIRPDDTSLMVKWRVTCRLEFERLNSARHATKLYQYFIVEVSFPIHGCCNRQLRSSYLALNRPRRKRRDVGGLRATWSNCISRQYIIIIHQHHWTSKLKPAAGRRAVYSFMSAAECNTIGVTPVRFSPV